MMWTWVSGTTHPVREDPQDGRAARSSSSDAGKEPAASGQGHGRVPHQRSRHGARRAAAQSQAQQGAAREERDPDRADRGRSARRDEDRVRIEHVGDAFWRVRDELRLHGDAEHSARSRASCASRASSSTSWRRRSSCPAARSGPHRIRACRSGRTSSSSVSPNPPATPRTSSRSRPDVWWRWERRSPSRAGCPLIHPMPIFAA